MSDNKEKYPSYIKIVIDKNEKVKRFLSSAAKQSVKTATIYGVGLVHFAHFLSELKTPYTLDEIVDALSQEGASALNIYDLLEDYVYYLMRTRKLAPRSIRLYTNAVRSYFAYYDIDVVPSKFKRKVKIPKINRYDEEAIDISDIRNILNSTSNKRLKAYLLVLASGGMRAIEAVAIRFKDIRYSPRPTMIHIRPEFSKTRVGRDIYISDEATKYLKEWIDFRFRTRRQSLSPSKQDDGLVFQHANNKQVSTDYIYRTLSLDFNEVLKTLKMDARKEGMLRRMITFVSFRSFVKTVISTQVNQDYSEWILGHARSTYWRMKEAERRDIYVKKCMKFLTFLDFTVLKATGQNIEAQLKTSQEEIDYLKDTAAIRDDEIDLMKRQFKEVRARLMKELNKKKGKGKK